MFTFPSNILIDSKNKTSNIKFSTTSNEKVINVETTGGRYDNGNMTE